MGAQRSRRVEKVERTVFIFGRGFAESGGGFVAGMGAIIKLRLWIVVTSMEALRVPYGCGMLMWRGAMSDKER